MLPIVLYSHPYGPNPWKVAIVLEELGLPYETRFVNFTDVKKEPYINLNPNGRLPAIEDPNMSITLFESGAIVEYLVEHYDPENKLHYTETAAKYQIKAWLHFQASGQGPYYGQASWFTRFHPERIPSAIERYGNEIRRVTGVLESVLKTREWLVGDKCTYADLCFLPWQRWASKYATNPETLDEDFPHVAAWYKKLTSRVAVRKVFKDQDRAIEEAEREKAGV
ncbi:glutathione S-transferase family protein [Aspergillus alliaceus]|uniref:glutathione S-transferase family protein n=1 Tax=Petromyces alliaceus TaxID=209559 RepID=UPI0012A713C9|nr:glutathione S-transferase [Aspergillus alliaceus]KAB8237671.1 glutathione S-transferase [Aspergillus alliaceus]